MRTHTDPPLSNWTIARRDTDTRAELFDLLQRNADRGFGSAVTQTADAPVISTGHQAALWHPGILAKDIAAIVGAERHGAQAVHIVVDHDDNDPLALDLPARQGDRLNVHTVDWPFKGNVLPNASTPALDADAVIDALKSTRDNLGDTLTVDLQPLIEAWRDLPSCESLAQQVACVLTRLRRPIIDPPAVLLTSQLVELPAFGQWVQRMCDDARACVEAYNEATRANPDAGVPPLRVEPNRVELPLWSITAGQSRRRVWCDLTAKQLTDDQNNPFPPVACGLAQTDSPIAPDTPRIVPRALTLSAFMRDQLSDLFIHGRGGAVYDRATDAWWSNWRGDEPLAPSATVSADVKLPFDVPVADAAELRRATWWAHHLPHNIDRHVPQDQLDAWTVARKRELIEHMDDDRDRKRRAAAFEEIHVINQTFATIHRDKIVEAKQRLADARHGVANRDIAMRRDWSFALYPLESMQELVSCIANSLTDDAPVHETNAALTARGVD